MQTLGPASSPQKTFRALRFSIRRLAPRPEAAGLHATVTPTFTTLNSRLSAQDGAHDARLDASAELFVLDDDVDTFMAEVVARALLCVGRDRKHPSFIAAFPTPPSKAADDVASDAQSRYVRTAIAALRADPIFASISAEVDTLEVKQDALEAGRANRDALWDAEQLARQQSLAAAEAARLAFNTIAPSLKLLYPGRRGLLRSFFLREEKEPGKATK